jgi:hypothetical protein
LAAGFIIGFFFCLAISATAVGRAHWIRPPKRVDHLTLEQRQRWLHRSWVHYAFVARHGTGRAARSNRRAARWARRELAHVRVLIAARSLYVPATIRNAFLCIHAGEGSWTDPGAPYYGGLQMDIEFQRAYGAALLAVKGTADHWTPDEQIHVAYRAYRTRGFYPWPNTARQCGLI